MFLPLSTSWIFQGHDAHSRFPPSPVAEVAPLPRRVAIVESEPRPHYRRRMAPLLGLTLRRHYVSARMVSCPHHDAQFSPAANDPATFRIWRAPRTASTTVGHRSGPLQESRGVSGPSHTRQTQQRDRSDLERPNFDRGQVRRSPQSATAFSKEAAQTLTDRLDPARFAL